MLGLPPAAPPGYALLSPLGLPPAAPPGYALLLSARASTRSSSGLRPSSLRSGFHPQLLRAPPVFSPLGLPPAAHRVPSHPSSLDSLLLAPSLSLLLLVAPPSRSSSSFLPSL